MNRKQNPNHFLAAAITKAASKQTYYTIKFFADREFIMDAYRAYAYFRWVDDVLDDPAGLRSKKIAFIERQATLLETCYNGQLPDDLCVEEMMLVDLICNDREENSGLRVYLHNMMDVMVFDSSRCGQTITQGQLADYSHKLAVAVTEALHYFIGHHQPSAILEGRYMAVTAAHITHMLRDSVEDVQAGYFNNPRETTRPHGSHTGEENDPTHRKWVSSRVQLANRFFQAGRKVLSKDPCLRRRLAGFAYTARFEWILRTIGQENYCIRTAYPDRKSLAAGSWMVWQTLKALLPHNHLMDGEPSWQVKNIRMGGK
jgi:phytoene/squalene synthetase